MQTDKIITERRLEEIESLWLEGATRTQIISRLQGPTPLPGCSTCQNRPAEQCKHGPPRWRNEQGGPLSVRTIQWYLQKAQTQVFQKSAQQRKRNRALTLAQVNRGIARCFRENNVRDLATLLRFRSELDGSKVAAEEEQEPTLYERVRSQMASCEDYHPGQNKKPKKPLSPTQARFFLERGEYLLQQADVSVSEFKKAKPPTNDVEARLYFRIQLVEAVHQSLLNPRLSPEGKREALQKLGATYAMISKDFDLAEQLTEVKQMLHDMKTSTSR